MHLSDNWIAMAFDTQGSAEHCCHCKVELAEHQHVIGWWAESFGGGQFNPVLILGVSRSGGGETSWLWVPSVGGGWATVRLTSIDHPETEGAYISGPTRAMTLLFDPIPQFIGWTVDCGIGSKTELIAGAEAEICSLNLEVKWMRELWLILLK